MVQYRCVAKGSQAKYEAQAERQIARLADAGRTDLFGSAAPPGVNEDELKALENSLAEVQKKASAPRAPTRADRMKQLIVTLERDGMSDELGSSELFKELGDSSVFVTFRALQEEKELTAKATDDAGRAYQKPYLDSARKAYEAELSSSIATLKSRVDGVAAQDAEKIAEEAAYSRESEKSLKERIDRMRAIISAAPAKHDSDKQAIDQEVSARSEKIRSRFAGVVTEEIYLWAIPKNGRPQLQSIRLLSTNAAGEVIQDDLSNNLGYTMKRALN